jgi:predicted ThiF/HesA family dinucleotide-utilizing enzyme
MENQQQQVDAKDLVIRRMGNKLGQLEIQLADAETRAEIYLAQLQEIKAEVDELKEVSKETQKPKKK